MNKKKLITIGSLALLLMVAAFAAGCGLKQDTAETDATQQVTTGGTQDTISSGQDQATTTETTGTTTDQTETTETTDQTQSSSETTGQVDEDSLINLAEKFAATYGTFSSQSNFRNVTELYSYMSENYRQESAAYVAEKQGQSTGGGYYETTTTVMMSKALENSGNAATVLVDTYRESSSSDQGRDGSYQNALIKFIQEGESWKVDKVEWQ